MGKQKRVQASKRKREMISGTFEMRDGFVQLRQDGTAQPHKNKSKYDRNAYRREVQAGLY